MRMTIDLPDLLLEHTKELATHRRTTVTQLVIEGLEMVLREGGAMDAVSRLRQGYSLGGHPFCREESHGR